MRFWSDRKISTRRYIVLSEKRKLTREEKRQIEAAIARAKNQDKKKKSAQDSIPFERMFPDGICRVNSGYFTKTIQFQDINYQLSQNEDKTAIFEGWCDFLNYFDSSVKFQLSFMNMAANKDTYGQSIAIPPQDDDFDNIREEYTEMLRNQLARGNNGLIKTKYLTFGIEAANMKEAKPRLDRIETDLLNNFKRLGVAAEPLNGKQRLALMHGMFHMDEHIDFHFEWEWLAPSGLSVKDFIAPSSFEFRTGKDFGMGNKLGAVSFLQILAPELNDRMLADFLDMESSLIVTMHIQSVDQTKAIKTVKRKITDLQKMTIEEQKKAVRSGYDMDIIPSDLATYGNEAKKILQDLQSRNERMFLLTFLVLNTAGNKQQLGNNVFQASSIAQKYNCQLTRLDFQQEEGLMSSLPLGLNQIEIQRGLTTSSVAIFVPFTTQELFQNGSEALYCGINALSGNLIMVDRKKLKNPNGLILGTPGSGKSFSAKREIANVFLVTDDDIIICDPEAEYGPLVERLHGQVIRISPTSPHYINPMDLNLNYSDEENPLSLKSDFILSLCELIVGGKEGLQPVEKTVIDRCVRLVYRDYLADPTPENNSKFFLNAAEFLAEQKVKFSFKKPVKVTFHKPCHLENDDFLKKLIDKCENVEYIKMKDYDECCGFAGEFAIKNPKLSISLAKQKAENAYATGADYILTSCPACVLGLREGFLALGKKAPKIMNVVEFLALAEILH